MPFKYVPQLKLAAPEKPESLVKKSFRIYNTPIVNMLPGGEEAMTKLASPTLEDVSDNENETERVAKKIFGETITSFLPTTAAKRKGLAAGMASAITPALAAQAASLGYGKAAVVANSLIAAQGAKDVSNTEKSSIERLLGGVALLGGGAGAVSGVKVAKAAAKAKAALKPVPHEIAPTPSNVPVSKVQLDEAARDAKNLESVEKWRTAAAKKKADEVARDAKNLRNVEAWKAKIVAEKAKVAENETKLAAIEAAKEGRVATSPAVSEGISAKTPEGGRASLSQRFVEPTPPKGEGVGAVGGAGIDLGDTGVSVLDDLPTNASNYTDVRKFVRQTMFSTEKAALSAALKTGGNNVIKVGRGQYRVTYPDPDAIPAGVTGPNPVAGVTDDILREADVPSLDLDLRPNARTSEPISPGDRGVSLSDASSRSSNVLHPSERVFTPSPPQPLRVGSLDHIRSILTPDEFGDYMNVRPGVVGKINTSAEDARYLDYQRRINGGGEASPPAVSVAPTPAPKGPTPSADVLPLEPDTATDFPFGANAPGLAEPTTATPVSKPTAKYIGEQPGLPAEGEYPAIPGMSLYNIEGGPSHGSSVSAKMLQEMGIDIPPTPPVVPPVPGRVIQEIQAIVDGKASPFRPKQELVDDRPPQMWQTFIDSTRKVADSFKKRHPDIEVPSPVTPKATPTAVAPTGIQAKMAAIQAEVDALPVPASTPVPAPKTQGAIPVAKLSKEARIERARQTYSPEANAELDRLRVGYDSAVDPALKRTLGARMSEISRTEKARIAMRSAAQEMGMDVTPTTPEPTVVSTSPSLRVRAFVTKRGVKIDLKAGAHKEAGPIMDRLGVTWKYTDSAAPYDPALEVFAPKGKTFRGGESSLLATDWEDVVQRLGHIKELKTPTELTSADLIKLSPEDQMTALTDLVTKFKANPRGPKGGPKGGSTLSMFGGGQLENMVKIAAENPAFARAVTTLVGAGTGAATNEEDPLTGAVVGAGIGFGSATVLQLLGKARTGALPQSAVPTVAAKVKDTLDTFMRMLPDFQRASLLSKPLPLIMNSVVGPWGAIIMHGTEDAVRLDPRGMRLLKLALNPKNFPKEYVASVPKAHELISSTAERTEGVMGLHGPDWYRTVTQYPGVAMTAGDEAARSMAKLAGYSDDEARAMTLTSEPYTSVGASVSKLKKGSTNRETGKRGWLLDMTLPFYRTNMNQIEQGLERTPFVGIWMNKYAKKMPASWQQQVAQQLIGGATGTVGYMLGEATPPADAKNVLKFINNFGGQYGAIASAGFVMGQARARGTSDWKALTRELSQAMPMPSTQPIADAMQNIGAAIGADGVEAKWPSGFTPGILDPEDPLTKVLLGAIISKTGTPTRTGPRPGRPPSTTPGSSASKFKYVPQPKQ